MPGPESTLRHLFATRAHLAVAAAAAVLVPGVAAAIDVSVEEWSAHWQGFSDDFEDDVHPDGGPGEPGHYGVSCGSIGDDDEFDGALHLRGPNAPCGGVIAGNTFGVQGPQTVRGLFAFRLAELGHSYGVSMGNSAGDDFITLSLTRTPVLPLLLNDAVGVFLSAEPVGGARRPRSASGSSRRTLRPTAARSSRSQPSSSSSWRPWVKTAGCTEPARIGSATASPAPTSRGSSSCR